MTYEKFLEELADKSDLFYPVGKNNLALEMGFCKMERNGVECDMLRVRKNKSCMAATINLTELYEENPNAPIEYFCVKVMEAIDDFLAALPNYQSLQDLVNAVPDLESRIFMTSGLSSAVNAEERKLPHIDIGDATFYPKIDFTGILPGNGFVSTAFDHNLMAAFGITEDRVMEIALNRAKDMSQYQLTPFEDLFAIGGLGGRNLLESEAPVQRYAANEFEISMYCLRDEKAINGAAALLSDVTLERAAKVLNDSLIILPSSIHEVILVPEAEYPFTTAELQQQIATINRTELKPKDILSYKAYHYDAAKKCLETMEDYEKRVALEADKKKSMTEDTPDQPKKCHIYTFPR